MIGLHENSPLCIQYVKNSQDKKSIRAFRTLQLSAQLGAE